MKHFGLVVLVFLFLLFGWISYSYTQVDLNLTLSSNALYQSIQQDLTHIGYFNRPFSTLIFLVLITTSFGFYFSLLHFVRNKLISLTHIKWLIGFSLLLMLAYPAFSHDFFNYMFDSRIVTKYGLDAHYFKALDFPDDTWTRFMHWTHRYYPYGGGFLLISLIPSYLGMGKFVLTLLMFKGMFVIFHLMTVWCIWKIAGYMDKKNQKFVTLLYALNPLVLVESLVSPHNEVLMIGICLVGIILLIRKQYIFSFIALILSISIKYISAVMMPTFIFIPRVNSKFFTYGYWLWVLGLIPVILSRELYPWYVVPLIALAALSSERKLWSVSIGLSAGTLFTYIPWLLTGEYTADTQSTQIILFGIGFVINSFLPTVLWKKSSS